MFLICFDFIIQCIQFSFQGQLTMNLEHDFFRMGIQKFHKVFLSMLLTAQVFAVVKLLGVVTM